MKLNQPILIMITSSLSILGLLVSLSSGLISGIHLPAILVRPFVSAICMACVGVGVYFFIQWQIPDLVATNSNQEDMDFQQGNDIEGSDTPEELSKEVGNLGVDNKCFADSGKTYNDDLPGNRVSGRKYSSVSEDTVVVDGISLENKPDEMARVIQHLMDQNEGEDG